MGVIGAFVLALAAAVILFSRWLALQMITLKPERRRPLRQRPEDHGVAGQDVQVTTEDELTLRGWYLPGANGATIMVQHGTPGGRQDGLIEAAFLNRRGYNVLLGSFRAHDDSDGVDVSFGYHETKDVAAWHNYLLGRREVDAERIGIFGKSMGGTSAIRYAAENEDIAAVVSASAPAVMVEAVEMLFATKLKAPRWSTAALARLFLFWAGRRVGCRFEEMTSLPHAGQISPRPLMIIHGGADDRVPAGHGRLYYDAAGEPKAYWFVEEAGHMNFELFRPAEYERRVVAFFDRTLLVKDED